MQSKDTDFNNYCTYETYTTSKLTCTPFQKLPSGEYEIPLMYNFGGYNKPVLSDFYCELCDITFDFDALAKRIKSKLSLSDTNHIKMIQSLSDLYSGCGYILFQYKSSAKMPHFNFSQSEATGFKPLIRRKRDMMTGEIIPGVNPTVTLNLTNSKEQKTIFTDLHGKEIEYDLLHGNMVTVRPLLKIIRIRCQDGKAELDTFVESAVVTSVEKPVTKQLPTIRRILETNSDLCGKLDKQLEDLRKDRNDKEIK